MRWLRSSQRFGAYLALFALTIQFVVSFSHFHPEDFRPWSGHSPSGTASPALSPIAALDFSVYTSHTQPGLPHRNCPVCVSVGLLSQGLNGQLPVLLAPTFFRLALGLPPNELQFSIVRYYPFRTRAPPVV
jgi:hypothetical protein